jgi:4-hydroxy-tetrahydrodipicolinate synthase
MPADVSARPFTGVIPAIVTPFTDDLAIDFDGLASNLEALVAAGIRGVVVTGTMGESDTLSREERTAIARLAVERFGDVLTVIAGISGNTAEMCSGYAREAAEAGVHGLMCLPPVTYAAQDDEIFAFFEEVTGATKLPFIVYNNPPASRIDMSARLVARLATLETVVAVKECSGDVRRIAEVLEHERADAPIDVLLGGDDWALEGTAGGAVGWISGCANVAPREAVALVEACREGNLELAQQINRALLPLARLDMSPKLVQYYKLGLDLTGRRGGISRPPRGALGEQDQQAVRDALQALRACPELPVGTKTA